MWPVIANYDDRGVACDAGNAKDGDGRIIFYNEDGTVRETISYKNGVKTSK